MRFSYSLVFVSGLVLLSGLMLADSGRAGSGCEDQDGGTAARQMIDRFSQAWNSDDAEALTSVFSEDGTFTSPSGNTARGRAEIRQLVTSERKQMFRGTTLRLSIESTREANSAGLIVEGRYTIEGLSTSLGIVELSSEGPFAFTMQRRQCQYLIVDAHTGDS